MKRILILLGFIFCFFCSCSQTIVQRAGMANTVADYRWEAILNMYAPRYADSATANLTTPTNNKGIDSCGAIIFCRDINGLMYRACNPKRWVAIATGTAGTYVDSVTFGVSPTVDTVLYWKNGTRYVAGYIDRGCGIKQKGSIIFDSLFVVTVTPFVWVSCCDGIRRVNAQTTLTFGASHATLNRFDAIALDDATGLPVIVVGTSAASPGLPVAGACQTVLTYVYIPATSTVLTQGNVVNEIIYDETRGVNAAEWDTLATSVTANFNNFNSPYHLLRAVSAEAVTSASTITFTRATPDSFHRYSNLVFAIKLKAVFIPSVQFELTFWSGTSQVSNPVFVSTGQYGFSRTITASYQIISVPISAFGTFSTDLFDILKIRVTGTNASGFYLDYIRLQGGLSTPSTSPNSFGVIQTQIGAAVAQQPTDQFYLLGVGSVTTSAVGLNGKRVLITGTGITTADNGLTKNTSTNVQLGGTLIQNTTISSAVAANRLTISGVNTFAEGAMLDVITSGNIGVALRGETTNGNGLFALSTGNGAAVYGSSTGGGKALFGIVNSTGVAIYGSAVDGVVLETHVQPASTNTVVPIATFSRESSGTAADGIGGSLDIYNSTSTTSNVLSNQLISKWATATHATRISQGILTGVSAGTTYTLATFDGAGTTTFGVAGTNKGSIALTGNTSGTITIQPQAAAGTYNFNLPITAGTSGYLLTSGGGSGTAMTWTDPATVGPTITASNGLTRTSNDIALGGTLTSSPTIAAGSNTLNFTGTATTFNVNNTTGTAVTAFATTGIALSAQTQGGIAGAFNINNATTNTIIPIIKLERFTSGTATAGIGASVDYYLEDGSNNTILTNRFISSLTTVTDGAEVSQLIITGTDAGTNATKLVIEGDGRIYGTGLHNAAGAVTGTTNQYIASGTFTSTVTNSTNTDATVTVTLGQWIRTGNVVTYSFSFTADPTTPAAATSFEFSLPIASNIAQVYNLMGTAFCGAIAAQGAAVNGVVANDTGKVFWVAGDVTNQVWSVTVTYVIL